MNICDRSHSCGTRSILRLRVTHLSLTVRRSDRFFSGLYQITRSGSEQSLEHSPLHTHTIKSLNSNIHQSPVDKIHLIKSQIDYNCSILAPYSGANSTYALFRHRAPQPWHQQPYPKLFTSSFSENAYGFSENAREHSRQISLPFSIMKPQKLME